MRYGSLIERSIRWTIKRPIWWVVDHPITWALTRAGYYVSGYGGVAKYGYDAFLDIERLSRAWHYPLNVFFDVGASFGVVIRRARHVTRQCLNTMAP